jgi:hypothetical protein
VLLAVTGKERHPPSADLADRDGPGGGTVGGVDGPLLYPLEERVEARASEESDLRRCQAVFSLVEPVSEVDESFEPAGSLDAGDSPFLPSPPSREALAPSFTFLERESVA